MKKSLKNKSKYMGKIKKEEKIKKLLSAHPEGLTPKQIALYSEINVSTVKNLVKNMPEIIKKRSGRGLYALDQKYPHGKIFDWNFHNLRLRVENIKIPKKVNKKITFSLFEIMILFNPNNNKVSMSLKNKERPFNIASLELVAFFFKSEIKKNTGENVKYSDIIVSSIEINQDFENLRIDGLKCITLDSLINQFKAYNKKGGLRIENKIKIPFPLDMIMEILVFKVPMVEVIRDVRELNNSYLKQEKEFKKTRNAIREIFKKRF